MNTIILLSSFVAASRVGGGAQAMALARLGLESALVPTVLLGRHPGWGDPGGAPVAPDVMEAMLRGVEAQGLLGVAPGMITGYFATPEQVAVAAAAVDRLRAANPNALVLVDPIIGDQAPGLFVPEPVARAIGDLLVPRADVVAPNAWELGWLTGLPVTDAQSVATAAAALGKPALVSSVEAGEEIGVVYTAAGRGWLASHSRVAAAPHGTGDLLSALFVAALVHGLSPEDALQVATGGVAEAVAAVDGATELAVGAFPAGLVPSFRVKLERLDG